jgi:hypothetical protein
MMTALEKPAVVFDVTDRGGEYFSKLQALAAGVDTAFEAFNQQLAAAQTAEQIRQATDQLRLQTAALVQQAEQNLQAAYAAIGTAGNTATFAVQLQTTRTINGKPFNGTQNVTIGMADIAGLTQRIADVELLALAGI